GQTACCKGKYSFGWKLGKLETWRRAAWFTCYCGHSGLLNGLAALDQGLQAGFTPSIFEPNLLSGTNVISFFPGEILNRLETPAIRANPEWNPILFSIRFRKRDRHARPP